MLNRNLRTDTLLLIHRHRGPQRHTITATLIHCHRGPQRHINIVLDTETKQDTTKGLYL